jgi:hypothetical protein
MFPFRPCRANRRPASGFVASRRGRFLGSALRLSLPILEPPFHRHGSNKILWQTCYRPTGDKTRSWAKLAPLRFTLGSPPHRGTWDEAGCAISWLLYLSRVSLPPFGAPRRLFRVCEFSCGNRLRSSRGLSPLEGPCVPRQARGEGFVFFLSHRAATSILEPNLCLPIQEGFPGVSWSSSP